MPIDYSRLHDILKKNETTLYKLSAEKVIGGKTREVLFGRSEGNISSRTVEALCKRLNCQPGDFMTYIPDQDERDISVEDGKRERGCTTSND